MQKLFLLSFIVAILALPMLAARDPSPVRGLRKALLWWATFNTCYLVAWLLLYPRLN
jgi:hypothetical protein